jgi:hypothetical protein
MSITIGIPDTHVRLLSDAVLIDRLRRDIAAGFRSGNRTALVGGYPIVVNDMRDDMRAWADSLTRDPGTATVTRHADGSADIVLTPAISVYLVPRAVAA